MFYYLNPSYKKSATLTSRFFSVHKLKLLSLLTWLY